MLEHVLILGAGGQIARHVIDLLSGQGGVRLTLFARSSSKLHRVPTTARVVEGDVLDQTVLASAMAGQDLVYANLTGDDIDEQAKAVIATMKSAGIGRLIFVTSLGIYDELPGKFQTWNKAMIGEELKPFRRASDAIEASGLGYTILRPAWLTDEGAIDYEITAKDETFRGTEVSRRSVADLIAKTIVTPTLHVRANLGVNKPGTDGDKPSFY